MRNEKVGKTGVLRKVIIQFCYYTGAIKILRFMNRKKIIILMVHGVSAGDMSGVWTPLRKTLDSDIMDHTLKRFKKHYTFITMEEAADMLNGKLPFKNNCMVVTFDDGYRNNIDIAYPILKKHKVPIQIYLSTGHVDARKAFWFDRLDYVIQKLPKGRYELEMGGQKTEIVCDTRDTKELSYLQFRKFVKSKSTSDSELKKFLDQTCERFEKIAKQNIYDVFENDPWISVLDWDTIVENSAKEDCEFGSHTVNHIRLAKVDEDTATEQLNRSKEMLEEKTNLECRHFAFPNGSYNAKVANLVRMCGYRTAVTTMNGMNRRGDDLMTLKRFPFPGYEDVKESLFIMSGLSMIFTKLKKTLSHARSFIC